MGSSPSCGGCGGGSGPSAAASTTPGPTGPAGSSVTVIADGSTAAPVGPLVTDCCLPIVDPLRRALAARKGTSPLEGLFAWFEGLTPCVQLAAVVLLAAVLLRAVRRG